MQGVDVERDSDESADLRGLISEVVADPDEWMRTPNDQLGGRSPNDLMGTGREERVRELVRAIKHGMFT